MKIWLSHATLSLVLFLAVAGVAAFHQQMAIAAIAAIAGVISSVASLRLLGPVSGVAEVLDDLANQRTPSRELGPETGELGTMVRATNRLAAKRLTTETKETGQHQNVAAALKAIAAGDLDNVATNQIEGDVGAALQELVGNLTNLRDHAHAVARGMESTEPVQMGELGEAVVGLSNRLQFLVKEISHTSVHLAAATEQMRAVLHDQEFAATQQASSVEETQRTMETLLSSARRIAESAQTVFKSAERTQANNRSVADRIGDLKGHSERIAEILEVIKTIADRSDLLALNASLEGLRAGEAGKGFTIVASEMRRLSENIKDSVGDIKDLLDDIRESSMSSVMATEEGTNLSEKTTESALKITLITQQQQSGTEQVTQSMDELSSLISHGVAGTRQLAHAADELVSLADDLKSIVAPVENPGRQKVESGINLTPRVSAKPTPDSSVEMRRPSELSGEFKAEAPAPLRPKRQEQPTLELSSMPEVSEVTSDAPRTISMGAIKGKSFDEQLDDLEKDIDL